MLRLLRSGTLVGCVALVGCAGTGGAGDDDLVDDDLDGFFANDPLAARRDCDDLPNHGEQINPSAKEKCDGTDNDCDGTIDEDGALGSLEWWPDGDGDGFGIRVETPRVACELPDGFAANRKDCNDADPAIYPQALERCNALDDDCDLVIDEGFDPGATWHADADEDGFGAAPVVGRGCASDPAWVQDGSDCNDINRFVNPDADELCNGVDDDCDAMIDGSDVDDLDVLKGARDWFPDGDGDGFGALVGQYVDTDGTVYLMGAVRSCPDEPPTDAFVTDSSDCNDFDAAINPTTVWNRDADHDGHGAPGDSTGPQCWQPIGYVLGADDCDDADPDDWSTRLWYADADRDGFGFGTTPVWEGCRPDDLPEGVWSSDGGDCADRDPSRFPGAVEICDTLGRDGADLDQDCDGLVGDADPSVTGKTRWFFDHDLDGFGTSFGAVDACARPSGYAGTGGDCDDNDPARRPDALWYVDRDRDGFGDPDGASAVPSCDVVPGHVPNDLDCNDRAYAQNLTSRWWTDADGDDLGTGIVPAITGCVDSTVGLADWTGDCDDTSAADAGGGCFGPQRGTYALVIAADRDAPYSLVTYSCLDPVTDVEVLPRRQYQLQSSDRNRVITLDLGTLPWKSRCSVTVKANGGDLSGDGPMQVDMVTCGQVVATIQGDLGVPAVPVDSPVVLVDHCSGCKDPAAENYDPNVIIATPPASACIYPP